MSSLSDILNSPLSAPPKGQTSNFVDPKSEGDVLTVVCSIFLFIMISFFSLRVYAKIFIARKFTWDDLTCTIGFLLSVIYYALNVVGVTSGYIGYHAWDVTVGNLSASRFFIVTYLDGVVNPAGLGFIKLTFFILYLQLFRPLKSIRLAIWVGAIVSTLFYTLVVVLAFIFTTPRPGENFATHLVSELEQKEIRLAIPQAGISVALDLYILILPIYSVWQLQLSRERKVGVSLVFLTGIMACLASILTLYYRIVLGTTNDLLTILVPTLITSLVEMQIGVICSCMPALYQILRAPKQGKLGSKSTSRAMAYARQKSLDSSDRGTDVDRSFLERGDPFSPRGYEMNSPKSVQTVIGSGKKSNLENNGIHLKHDLYQERGPKRGAESTVSESIIV